jgi:uridine kinase
VSAESPDRPRVLLGIAGGSGSGKSALARAVAEAFRGRSTVVCHDWYYKDNSRLSDAEALKVNVDHPSALESSLLGRHLDRLLAGEAVDAPVYDYATHARLARTQRVEPRPLMVLDGILILGEKSLRERMTVSVFIDVPDDVRLMRRVRRDCVERRIELEETLRLYEDFVRPMHKRYVTPSSHHATWIWSQLDDAHFPDLLIRDLERRLGPAPAARRPAARGAAAP